MPKLMAACLRALWKICLITRAYQKSFLGTCGMNLLQLLKVLFLLEIINICSEEGYSRSAAKFPNKCRVDSLEDMEAT